MEIEETIKFILESQAKAEARADRAEARMDRADARMDRAEKKAEREMAAIRKLLQQGMKALVELTESQKETSRELKALIKSLRNSGNRRNGRNGH
jgi:predicted transcriptional regulator